MRLYTGDAGCVMAGPNERNAAIFAKDIDAAYAKKILPAFLEFHKTVVIKAYQLVIRDSREVGFQHGSPVWSGRFRKSHNVSIGVVDGSVSAPNPAAKFVNWPDEPESVLSAKGVAYVRGVLEKLRPFDIVYISNSVPYAKKLEEGYSPKAPEGVYDVAASTLRAQLKGNKLIGFLS